MGGLNWSEGLKAAAQGTALLQRSSEQKTDLLYKQISEANMMRFKKQEAATERQFRLDQTDAQNAFKSEENKLNRESADTRHSETLDATTALREATLANTAAYQGAMIGQGQERLDQTGARNQAQITEAKIKQIDIDAKGATNWMDPKPEENKALVKAWSSAEKKRAAWVDGSPEASRFDEAYEMFGGREDARAGVLATAYAKMSEKEVRMVSEKFNSMYKPTKDQNANYKASKLAWAKAIQEVSMSKGLSGLDDIGDKKPKPKTPPDTNGDDSTDTGVNDPVVAAPVEQIAANTPVTRRGQQVSQYQIGPTPQARDKAEWIKDRANAIAVEKGYISKVGVGVVSKKERKEVTALAEAEWMAQQKNPSGGSAEFIAAAG